jgi:DNA-binding transcriptional LysR family regulator
VLSEAMMLALPESHPLCAGKDVVAADLSGQDWIAVRHRATGLNHESFIAACARAGFTPSIHMEASDPMTALGLVAAGLGMAIVQQGLRHQTPPGVVLRALPWFSYRAPLWVAWHRVNLRPLVAIFRETLLAPAAAAAVDAAHEAPVALPG